ncbi:MAG: PQQ-dependent sugar dehydrogenase, partial [Acidimicrobiia bacterium]
MCSGRDSLPRLPTIAANSKRTKQIIRATATLLACVSALIIFNPANHRVGAQATGPSMLDPNLSVRAVVSGLAQPTTMAFLADGDMLVLEKASGKVQRVMNGAIAATVLDLAVNSGSERGLLGIALHPEFPNNAGVYLYWTESATGADTEVLSEVPLLGNRVDRFVWDGSSLAFDHNVIRLRALQQDAGQPERGNHDGGILKFGPDGKLYIFVGDLGRRGQLQNLPCGPAAECPGPT